MTSDDDLSLLLLLLRRPRSRLKAYARMRKRDRMFAAWSNLPPSVPTLTSAVAFALEEPLLEADRDERDQLLPWWRSTSNHAARELYPEYGKLAGATQLARDDMLIRLASRAAVSVFGTLGLVMFWEWVTQRDARVCEKCGPLDGRVLEGGRIPLLPLHPRCRCGLRPVVRQVAMMRAG